MDVVTKCRNISPNFMIVISRLRKKCEEMFALGDRILTNEQSLEILLEENGEFKSIWMPKCSGEEQDEAHLAFKQKSVVKRKSEDVRKWFG